MSDETTLQVEQGSNEAVISQPLAQAVQQEIEKPLISFNTTAPETVQQKTPNAYESIIEQQQAQIAALMTQNDALNQQVTRMVQGGAQFNQQSQQVGQNWAYTPQQPNMAQQFAQGALSNGDDWSLEALGKEIGKPRREV